MSGQHLLFLLVFYGRTKVVRILRERKWFLEGDVGLLVIGFCDQRSRVTLLLALHVQSSHLFDLEAVEGFEETLDFDLGS